MYACVSRSSGVGFHRIENLDAYVGLKVLYLEGNAFTQIEGLQALKELRCL